MSYYKSTILKGNMDEVIDRVTEALKEEGFGILTDINVAATFKKKLDIDFKPYRILGACNPNYAHQAISNEDKIGVFLPCNVIVIDQGEGNIEVAAVDPISSMMSVKNDSLGEVATAVQSLLYKTIDKL